MNKRDQLAQRVIALQKISIFVFNFLCIRTSLHSYFSVFRADCLYQFWEILLLIACRYTSLDCICFSLSLWTSVVVIGYIITHCMCICQSLDSCLFSVSLSVPILSLIAVLYVLLLIRVCHSLFVGAVGVGGVGVNVSILLRLYCHWLYV